MGLDFLIQAPEEENKLGIIIQLGFGDQGLKTAYILFHSHGVLAVLLQFISCPLCFIHVSEDLLKVANKCCPATSSPHLLIAICNFIKVGFSPGAGMSTPHVSEGKDDPLVAIFKFVLFQDKVGSTDIKECLGLIHSTGKYQWCVGLDALCQEMPCGKGALPASEAQPKLN